MEKGTLDIEASIVFEKFDEIPADLAIKAIQCINDAFFFSELDDLRYIRQEFKEIPRVAFDAAEYRMRQHKRQSVLLHAVNKGSLEIAVVGTGLAVWFLKQTIGETIKEAWHESELHKKIKRVLVSRRSDKNRSIMEDAKRRLEQNLRIEVQVGYSDDLKRVHIGFQIWIPPDYKEPFPRRHDQLLE